MTIRQFVKYAKKFLIAVAAALGVAAAALSDGVVTPSEWVQIVLAALGALGVYRAANDSHFVKQPK